MTLSCSVHALANCSETKGSIAKGSHQFPLQQSTLKRFGLKLEKTPVLPPSFNRTMLGKSFDRYETRRTRRWSELSSDSLHRCFSNNYNELSPPETRWTTAQLLGFSSWSGEAVTSARFFNTAEQYDNAARCMNMGRACKFKGSR